MITILIVDDEWIEREALKSIILDLDLPIGEVETAKNAQEALEYVKTKAPDILLLDVVMPGINGLELLRIVQDINSNIKCVISSAYDIFDYAHEAIELNAAGYLLKPVRRTEIKQVLERLIRQIEEEQNKEEETRNMRKQLGNLFPYIKSSLMVDMLNGVNEDTYLERAKLLDFSLLPCSVMVVDTDDFSSHTKDLSESGKQLLKKTFFNVVEEAVGKTYSTLILPMFHDEIMFLINTSEMKDPESECVLIADRIRECVRKNMDLTCCVALSEVCDTVVDIPAAFCRVRDVLSVAKIFLGRDQTINSQDISLSIGEAGWYPYREERRLVYGIKSGDRSIVEDALEVYIRALREKRDVPPDIMRRKIAEFMAVIVRDGIENGIDSARLVKEESNFYEEMAKADSVAKCIQIIEKSCRDLVQLFLEEAYVNDSNLIKKAELYLHENYKRNISLIDVSGHVALNPQYFSRLFKDVTGKNYSEYLTELRIEQAKMLLTHKSMRIGEVARDVGFSDASYFSRIFSKNVGMAPRDYQKEKCTG